MSSSRLLPSTRPAGTYTVSEYPALEQSSRNATSGHLVAAAEWLSQTFEANDVPHAFMGGFSLLVRGSPRDTYDIDAAVGCNMARLKEVLAPQQGVLQPLNPVSGVMRIFVRVGAPLDPGLSETFVEVDLILGGSLGAPVNPEIASEHVSLRFGDRLRRFRLLNVQSMMSAKLGAACARSSRSDFDDILFLILKYPEQVHQCRHTLDQNHRRHFIGFLQRSGRPRPVIDKAQQALGIIA